MVKQNHNCSFTCVYFIVAVLQKRFSSVFSTPVKLSVHNSSESTFLKGIKNANGIGHDCSRL